MAPWNPIFGTFTPGSRPEDHRPTPSDGAKSQERQTLGARIIARGSETREQRLGENSAPKKTGLDTLFFGLGRDIICPSVSGASVSVEIDVCSPIS